MKINLLISYAYMDDRFVDKLNLFNKKYPSKLNFLLDSGSFTANAGGKEVDINAYIEKIQHLEKTLDFTFHYMALDKIGNFETTYKNIYYMFDQGLKPLPIINKKTPLHVIDEYYQLNNYCGLGDVASRKNLENIFFISQILKKCSGKLHVLGFGSYKGLLQMKPYSADSTTWNAAGRFGRLTLFTSKGFVSYTKKEFKKKHAIESPKLFQKIGFCPYFFLEKKNWTRENLNSMSIRSHFFYKNKLEKVGTNFFFAAHQFEDIFQEYDFMIENNLI